MDPGDIGKGDAADDTASDSPPTGHSQISAPGSLMSLKIRKRAPTERVQPASPTAPRAQAAEPPRSPSPDGDEAGGISDAISRVARRAKSAGTAPQPSAFQHHADKRTPAESPAVPSGGPTSPHHGDIVAYWTRLKGGRRFPKSTEIDPATIAESWPNSILIRSRPGSRVLEPDKVFLAGKGAAPGLSGLRAGSRVNLSPMMLQWLLGLAGEVMREGRPMNDVETFPSVKRVVHYRAVALPFSDNESAVDHVLCHFRPET